MSDPGQRLQRRVENNREQRARHASQSKAFKDRVAEIDSAADEVRTDFWCEPCQQDFESWAHKEVRFSHSGALPIAWYVGYCPVGHKALRRITDKLWDPYYQRSDLVRRQRVDLADALIQPSDPRFRYVYPEAWRKMQETAGRAAQAV